MSGPGQEFVELFLQEASEHLQFLREYSGVLLDSYPRPEDVERLYIAAHGLAGTAGTYGYRLFSEVTGKLAHIFQYAMNSTIGPDAGAPLVEFIYEAIAVLESDLMMISANSLEAEDDIKSFKHRYPFAFQPTPAEADEMRGASLQERRKSSTPANERKFAGAAPKPPVTEPAPAVESTKPTAPAAQPQAAEPEQTASPKRTDPTPAAPQMDAPPVAAAESQDDEPLFAAPATPVSASLPEEPVARLAEKESAAAVESPVETVRPSLAETNELPVSAADEAQVSELEVAETSSDLEAAVADVARLYESPPAVAAAPSESTAVQVEGSPASVTEPADEQPLRLSAPLPAMAKAEPLLPMPLGSVLALDALSVLPPVFHPTRPMLAPEVAPPAAAALPVLEEAPPAEAEMADLPPDGKVATEVLEFFIPEAEEHLQSITQSLLLLEVQSNPREINKVFREMHTIKGSAAQLGLRRLSTIAHRTEDLVSRLRNGEVAPNAGVIDLCLEAVDILKKQLYHQWPDEHRFQEAVKRFFRRVDQVEKGGAAGAGEKAAPAGTMAAAVVEPHSASLSASQSVSAGTPSVPELLAEELPAAEELPQPELAAEAVAEEFTANGAVLHGDPGSPAALPFAGVEGPGEEIAALAAGRREPAGVPQSKSVRIALERLDRMMNAVGELVINRTRMLGRLQELEALADVLNFSKARLIDKVGEFQEKYEFRRVPTSLGESTSAGKIGAHVPRISPLRVDETAEIIPYPSASASRRSGVKPSVGAASEFSELEMDRYDDFGILSRSLTEISADITEVLTQLDGFVRRVDGDIDEFTKLAHRLQDEITQSRMVPIGNLYTRLSRAVRDSAKAAGKRVEAVFTGAETELDNNIIQQIADPLVHLVRNAVAHGIEGAEERYNSGKSDCGTVSIRAYHRGNLIFIEVEDDGRGIDYQKLRNAAVELELMDDEQARELSDRDLLDLMFLPGFSTARRKTELAGRGVGLDVVHTNLQALNGEVEIETTKGVGTRFTLKVPLTLIISQALFVRVGKHLFALPLSFVESIRRIKADDIEEGGGKYMARVRGVMTEVVHLDSQLGLPPFEPVNGWYKMVMTNIAGKQVGIIVEEVLGKDEIVIKNLGEYLRSVKMFPGATIASDGRLILLVDVNRLVMGEVMERRPLMTAANAARIFMPGSAAVAAGTIPEAAIDRVEKEKLIVLVDDSISVRKFVSRMLEKAGYRVQLASDGLEALETVAQGGCDLVITDLEMPRTNGYELMLHLRQNPETRHIPVMVVTSRAGSKHRDRALREGAQAFMVKPVQEEQLIAQVASIIGRPDSAGSKLLAGR